MWRRAGTRSLIAICALLLGLGLVVVVHLSGDGVAISGENKLDQRLAPGQVSTVDAARALDFDDQAGQRSLYATLGETVPGVTLVVDPTAPALSTAEALALGRVARIVEAVGFEVDRPDRAPELSGEFRLGDWRAWELHLVDDAASVLLVRDRRGVTLLVDARLIDTAQRRELIAIVGGLDLAGSRSGVATRPGTLVGAVREAGVLIALLLIGGLLLPVATVPGRGRPAMALLIGVAVQGGVGAFVSGIALILVPALVALAVAVWLTSRRGPVGWTSADVPAVVATSSLLLIVSLLTRARGLVVVSTDGGSYLVRAAMQAASDGAPLGSKGAAYSALHATGMLAGADGMFALGPALLVAATALIARTALGVLRASAHRLRTGSATVLAPILLALVLGLLVVLPITSPGIRFSSMLVHAHLLVAAQSVGLVALWMSRDPSGRQSPIGGEVAAAAALAGCIVLARPEGFIVPLAILLGTLRTQRTRPLWSPVFVVTGLAVTAQYGFDASNLRALVEALGDEGRSRGALGGAGSGLIGPVIALAPFLLRPLPTRWRAQLPLVVSATVWAGLIAAIRSGALRLDQSLDIARENVFAGAGGWGLTLPVLAILTLFSLGLLLPRLAEPRLGPIVTLAVLFVPLAQLSKNLGDGVGRVHWHDSVNRIWMHVLLVVVLLAVIAVAELAVGGPSARRWLARACAPVLVLLMIGTARLWEPALILEDPVERTVSSPPGPAVSAVPELVAGRQVLHAVEIEIPDRADLRRAVDVALCADIRFGTYRRANTGRVEVRAQLGDRTVTTTVDSAGLVDNAAEPVCWSLGSGPQALDQLVPLTLISVRGLDPAPAPTVMLTAEGVPDIVAVLRWDEPARWNAPLVRDLPRALAVLLSVVLMLWAWGSPSSRPVGLLGRAGGRAPAAVIGQAPSADD